MHLSKPFLVRHKVLAHLLKLFSDLIPESDLSLQWNRKSNIWQVKTWRVLKFSFLVIFAVHFTPNNSDFCILRVMIWNDMFMGWEGAAGSDVNIRNLDLLLPLLMSSSKKLSWSLCRLLSLPRLLSWPGSSLSQLVSLGGLGMGVGLWAACAFSAAQSAASVI